MSAHELESQQATGKEACPEKKHYYTKNIQWDTMMRDKEKRTRFEEAVYWDDELNRLVERIDWYWDDKRATVDWGNLMQEVDDRLDAIGMEVVGTKTPSKEGRRL